MLALDQCIAHRGASAYAPENTISAFRRAHELGANWVEFDVMLSEDGVPFIFHDEKLKRTTRTRGEFGKCKAEYLSTLDAGSWFSKHFAGEKIPTLDEMLKWLLEFNMHANIEIKPYPGQTEATTIAVLSAINQHWPLAKKLPLISSFDWEALSLCKNISPEMPLGLVTEVWNSQALKIAEDLECVSVHLDEQHLGRKIVKDIKDKGYLLGVYTVNSKKQAKKLFKWGVDAVFTDYPDLLL